MQRLRHRPQLRLVHLAPLERVAAQVDPSERAVPHLFAAELRERVRRAAECDEQGERRDDVRVGEAGA